MSVWTAASSRLTEADTHAYRRMEDGRPSRPTGWPKKVNHYQMIKKNRIKS